MKNALFSLNALAFVSIFVIFSIFLLTLFFFLGIGHFTHFFLVSLLSQFSQARKHSKILKCTMNLFSLNEEKIKNKGFV